MRRVGVLLFVPALGPVVDGFRRGLEGLGFQEGRDVEYVQRSVEGRVDQLPAAVESLGQQVDLILACGTPAAKAAAQGSRPVVFAPVFDPVGAGLVERADQPGRPVTGVSGMIPGDRKLAQLSELFPGLSEVTVLFNPQDPNSPVEAASLEAAGEKRGIAVRRAEVTDVAALEAALPKVMAEAQVILLSLDRLTDGELERIAAAAREARKPLVAHNAAGVRRGALVALEADPAHLGRRAAAIAQRILNGADPARIPVEYAEEARLVLNAGVAEAVGYRLPGSVQPDEVVPAERGV
ncbi:MAG: ABC transporter substrate-binding protein [Bacillota bacterium]|nr:ABC transporter substrate-binding protein [Bacillota bacterium]